MKKVLVILLSIMLVSMGLVGCAAKDDDGAAKGDGKYEIALITDKGNIDDKSFNQGAWEGVVAYAKANDKTHTYIKPEEASDAGYLAAIDLAVDGGAKVIVTPGFLFEVPIYEAQTKYPEVKFILLDGAPHTADYATFETKALNSSFLATKSVSEFTSKTTPTFLL